MPHIRWNLSSGTRDWTCAPALEVQNLNHWTAREVTLCLFGRVCLFLIFCLPLLLCPDPSTGYDFPSAWKVIPFGIWGSPGDTLSFCLSENDFIPEASLKHHFSRFHILGWQSAFLSYSFAQYWRHHFTVLWLLLYGQGSRFCSSSCPFFFPSQTNFKIFISFVFSFLYFHSLWISFLFILPGSHSVC